MSCPCNNCGSASVVESSPFTSPQQVRSVYPDMPETSDVTAAITTAHALVMSSIVNNGCGSNYTAAQLELIERWLAAHLWQVQNGVITSKSAGSASESYQMNTDFFLKGTLHGQQAMLLDPNGCLAKLMADTQKTLEGARTYTPVISPLSSPYSGNEPRPIQRN